MKYNKPFKEGRALRGGRGPRDLQRDMIKHTVIASVDNSDLIEELRSQIRLLREELKVRPTQKGYSAEEFDEELVKASEQIMNDIESKFKTEIDSLKHDINNYKQTVLGLSDELESEKYNNHLKDKDLKRIEEKISILNKEISNLEKEVGILEVQLKSTEEIIKAKDDTIMTLKTTAGVAVAIIEDTDPDRPQMEKVFVDPLERDANGNLESFIEVKEDIQEDEKVDEKVDKLKALLGKLPIGG